MNLNTEPIRNWFGFTRRERRSTFTLLVIIVFVLGIRFATPGSRVKVEDITEEYVEPQDNQRVSGNDSNPKAGIKFKRSNTEKTYTKGGNSYKASKTSYTKQQINRSKEKAIVDINSADTSALIRLPGIGPVLSERIVKYRHFLGGFARIEQLKEVYGLSEETYELIKTRVTADSAFITRININTADYKELSKVRYLEKYEITSILKYRQLKSKINDISDIVDNKLITSEKAQKIRPYLRFD